MKAILALEDGTWFTGQSFTGHGEAGGEVIFNTGMSGYQEILTDPSYYGQMVCMTYPLIGNYGVNLEDVESSRIHCPALIVKECCKKPSNWRAKESLPDYLTRHGVMGLEGIDTRALTRHLRIHGAMRGIISTTAVPPGDLVAKARALPSMEGANLIDFVAPTEPYYWTAAGPAPAHMDGDMPLWPAGGGDFRVIVYDYGIKWNILRLLKAQNLAILVVPPNFAVEAVKKLSPHGIFLSNGPGDPATLTEAVAIIKEICELYPVAGICLGHQLLGIALGGSSFKLKFGHHGINHPVRDDITGKIEISSQNHGFCVDISRLAFLEQTHLNLNDQTLEGFRHRTKPIFSVQHHPEAGPGPHDSQYFFGRFRRMLETGQVQ
ncbi:MAG: glutamine-hydrolyzing carbamoyl-phosphate synthase small subunit [Desulfovibrionales bacterium]|nr:glutamine-hydrolyzing carbamoyl-phosphate synthase small subunit [Desulfovibrionales bacterium]